MANDKQIFLMKRPLQWSHLTSGLPIPRVFQELTYDILGRRLNTKENMEVRVMFGGEIFNVKIYNIDFNRKKYEHTEILQFKYDNNRQLLDKLQSVFSNEYRYCLEARQARKDGDTSRIDISKYFETNLIVYGTSEPDLFIWEAEFENLTKEVETEIKKMTEEEFEAAVIRSDPHTGIKQKQQLVKIRQLDNSIGDSLKRVYGYRCQMTGEYIGNQYGVSVVEAQHILPFTQSLNNDTSNIMILSPNYHRIVHKAKPQFNRKFLSFEYPNGLVEKIKLNRHL
ncbi:MAG: hypothetical protein Q4E32_07605 [Bacteroidales bacterium]|nr:hypothetical protein [Bacteroidales bacterium]